MRMVERRGSDLLYWTALQLLPRRAIEGQAKDVTRRTEGAQARTEDRRKDWTRQLIRSL